LGLYQISATVSGLIYEPRDKEFACGSDLLLGKEVLIKAVTLGAWFNAEKQIITPKVFVISDSSQPATQDKKL